MFIKIKEKWTLVENFQEAIKVEKDLASISSHLSNARNKNSTYEDMERRIRECPRHNLKTRKGDHVHGKHAKND